MIGTSALFGVTLNAATTSGNTHYYTESQEEDFDNYLMDRTSKRSTKQCLGEMYEGVEYNCDLGGDSHTTVYANMKHVDTTAPNTGGNNTVRLFRKDGVSWNQKTYINDYIPSIYYYTSLPYTASGNVDAAFGTHGEWTGLDGTYTSLITQLS